MSTPSKLMDLINLYLLICSKIPQGTIRISALPIFMLAYHLPPATSISPSKEMAIPTPRTLLAATRLYPPAKP